MTQKLKFAFVIALFATAGIVAQETAAPPKMERKTAEATWPEGKLTISYGAPAWQDKFKDAMKDMKDAWRLGNNLPTTATLTAGLDTAAGAIPPGEYRLALKPGSDNKWSLLFYEAVTFYDKAYKTWEIPADGPVMESKAIADKLDIKFDGAKMNIAFGPMKETFTLKPIKVNPPIKTKFREYDTVIEVLALPLAGRTFKDTEIGVATVGAGEIKGRYHMKLTVDGDKASLNFVNERAAGLPKEKEQLEEITKRITEMLAEHPERKEGAEPILAGVKKNLDEIDTMAKAFERLQPAVNLTGTVAKSDKANTDLGLSYNEEGDRKMGILMLNLNLGNSNASFEIKPKDQFMKPRKKAE